MPAIRPDPPPQWAAQQSEEQQQQHFAAAMQATMTMQKALDNEEDMLVAEARGVGMAWPEIAAVLPTRSMADLKRRHNTRIAAQVSSNAHAVSNHGISPAPQRWHKTGCLSCCPPSAYTGTSEGEFRAPHPTRSPSRCGSCTMHGVPRVAYLAIEGRMPHLGISLRVS